MALDPQGPSVFGGSHRCRQRADTLEVTAILHRALILPQRPQRITLLDSM